MEIDPLFCLLRHLDWQHHLMFATLARRCAAATCTSTWCAVTVFCSPDTASTVIWLKQLSANSCAKVTASRHI